MNPRTIAIAAVGLAIAATAAWIVFSGPEGDGTAGDPGPGRHEAGAAPLDGGDAGEKPNGSARSGPAVPPRGHGATAGKTAAAKRGSGIGQRTKPPAGAAIFPDGTWLAPLNGAIAPHPCPWPKSRPYSPVVEIVTGDQGIQWYRHADGSHSNTQLVKRTEGGRTWVESAWAVGNPTKALPVQVGTGQVGTGQVGKGQVGSGQVGNGAKPVQGSGGKGKN